MKIKMFIYGQVTLAKPTLVYNLAHNIYLIHKVASYFPDEIAVCVFY